MRSASTSFVAQNITFVPKAAIDATQMTKSVHQQKVSDPSKTSQLMISCPIWIYPATVIDKFAGQRTTDERCCAPRTIELRRQHHHTYHHANEPLSYDHPVAIRVTKYAKRLQIRSDTNTPNSFDLIPPMRFLLKFKFA